MVYIDAQEAAGARFSSREGRCGVCSPTFVELTRAASGRPVRFLPYISLDVAAAAAAAAAAAYDALWARTGAVGLWW